MNLLRAPALIVGIAHHDALTIIDNPKMMLAPCEAR
jgi:hypothetical protein